MENDKNKLTRRDFLKLMAVAGVAASAAGSASKVLEVLGQNRYLEQIGNPRLEYPEQLRDWEKMYRNMWQYDKVARSTHGVNCTGSCSWFVYVKDGIVAWELQADDYPEISPAIPNYDPRGCPGGLHSAGTSTRRSG